MHRFPDFFKKFFFQPSFISKIPFICVLIKRYCSLISIAFKSFHPRHKNALFPHNCYCIIRDFMIYYNQLIFFLGGHLMLAKIVSDNREYYSHIFAKFNPGWFECVIVFDTENKRFELLNVYNTKPSIKRKVFIIDTDITDMVEKKEITLSMTTIYKDCFGYSWLLDNCDLIKQIKDGKAIDEKYIKIAEEQNKHIDTSEWKLIKSQKDADNLLSAAWGFHDATFKSIRYFRENYNDPSCVRVSFTGCYNCDIVLEFKKDVFIHFNYDDNTIPDILDSNILFHDGFVYWVNDSIKSVDDLTESYIYFRARSLAWKMITNNDED